MLWLLVSGRVIASSPLKIDAWMIILDEGFDFKKCFTDLGVEPNIGGKKNKMDGENNGKAYEQMDDLGGFPPIFGNPHLDNLGQ